MEHMKIFETFEGRSRVVESKEGRVCQSRVCQCFPAAPDVWPLTLLGRLGEADAGQEGCIRPCKPSTACSACSEQNGARTPRETQVACEGQGPRRRDEPNHHKRQVPTRKRKQRAAAAAAAGAARDGERKQTGKDCLVAAGGNHPPFLSCRGPTELQHRRSAPRSARSTGHESARIVWLSRCELEPPGNLPIGFGCPAGRDQPGSTQGRTRDSQSRARKKNPRREGIRQSVRRTDWCNLPPPQKRRSHHQTTTPSPAGQQS